MSADVINGVLAAVLGTPGGSWVRPDTVLADIGVDSLARLLIVDAAALAGLRLDPQRVWTAVTVADLHGEPGGPGPADRGQQVVVHD